tara:strand:+ start:837 stop:1949 length:1113 start_codon:yes stop_codon:yes gene_type:complete
MKINYTDIKDTVLDIKPDKRTEVWNWGADNGYPSLIQQLISMSVTTKTCVDKVAKAIYGKSFGDIGNVIVNKNGQSLNEVLRLAAREFAKQNNIFLHVGYDGNLKINSLKIIPSTHIRKGKSDDRGYSGKWVVYNNWDRQESQRIESKKFQLIDTYNPITAVIEAQIVDAKSISKYKGQVLHIQKDPSAVYSLSDLQPVLGEALLEHNSQVFRSRGAERGFLNTKLMVTQPFASEDDRDDFIGNLEGLQGGENAGRTLVMEASSTTEDLNNQMKLEDLSSPYNDKLFEYSDSQAQKNISLAFNVPQGLVSNNDNGLFGNSGELIKSMKIMLFESREEERDMLVEAISKIMDNWHSGSVNNLEIINPYTEI